MAPPHIPLKTMRTQKTICDGYGEVVQRLPLPNECGPHLCCNCTRSMDDSGEQGLKHNARGYYTYIRILIMLQSVQSVSSVTVYTFEILISSTIG